MKTVILDAGHGKETAGKRSPIWEDGAQLFEWEFNRDIVRRIAEQLDKLNIPYHILTPEDIDISLPERAKRANQIYQADNNTFLISVHANAGGGTGWEAFTSEGQTASDKFAEILYRQAEKYLGGVFPLRTCGVDGDSDKESRFYILRKTQCPAILTENLFMDTEKDCRFIMSEEGRDVIAKLHADAICEISKL